MNWRSREGPDQQAGFDAANTIAENTPPSFEYEVQDGPKSILEG
jgi:hypothetical protein